MSSESPFFLSKIECPICKTVNEFETVRVGAYYEDGRDTDFCPTSIRWRYPRYDGYNPLVFFTATCGNCYYTREFTKSFKEWKSDNNFRTYRLKSVKEKHLDQLAVADSIVKKMGESIDVSRHPNESAIIKLNLAIFDELLCEHPSDLDLGRFYLRLAWIFRDQEKGENPGLRFLRGLMLEVDNRFQTFRERFESARQELAAFARHLSSHFESNELSSEVKARMGPFKDKLMEQVQSLAGEADGSSQRLQTLVELMEEYKAVAMGDEVGGEAAAYGQWSSFGEFLMSLKRGWEGIVTNEREALEKAIHYYKRAFSSGRDISPGNQQIQASYLIAELSRRIGEHDDARQYFNSTIKHGQEFIYQNRKDPSRTALARKILELAIEQGRANMEALKSSQASKD
ncbi:MAG: DUF2225 domain-containing protein [Candidatus Zixiibacteriota bacterium]|nr:MAG: DUF2225 domain-containing protein [candidate division Zixibacteria bacterium]